jgi:hypothetical protein
VSSNLLHQLFFFTEFKRPSRFIGNPILAHVRIQSTNDFSVSLPSIDDTPPCPIDSVGDLPSILFLNVVRGTLNVLLASDLLIPNTTNYVRTLNNQIILYSIYYLPLLIASKACLTFDGEYKHLFGVFSLF